MKNKKKITVLILCMLFMILIVGIGLWYFFIYCKSEEPDVIEDPVQSTVSDNDITPDIQNEPDEDEEVVYDVDRTPKFDNYENMLIESFDGVTDSGYILSGNTEESQESAAETISEILMTTEYSWYNNNNDFSNGFITLPSDNMGSYTGPWGETSELLCVDGSKVRVTEYDPIGNTIESIRDTMFEIMGLQLYVAYGPKELTGDEDWVKGVGLNNYNDYFEYYSEFDPTITMYYQVIADTTISTKFGDGLYIVIYNKLTGSFTGYALIQTERERILYVDCTSDNYDYLIPYIKEATDSCIILVE